MDLDLFKIFPISMGVNTPIESIASYKGLIYLGAKKGCIYIYTISLETYIDGKYYIPEFLKKSSNKDEEIKFSSRIYATRDLGKKSIPQLSVIREFEILIGIVDSNLACLALPACQTVEKVASPHSFFFFSHIVIYDENESINCPMNLLLVACSKKRLSFFTYSIESKTLIESTNSPIASINSWPNEITLPDMPKSVSFINSSSLLIFYKTSIVKYDNVIKEFSQIEKNLKLDPNYFTCPVQFWPQKVSTDIFEDIRQSFLFKRNSDTSAKKEAILKNLSTSTIIKDSKFNEIPNIVCSDQRLRIISDENDRSDPFEINPSISALCFPPFLLLGHDEFVGVIDFSEVGLSTVQRIPLQRVNYMTHNHGLVFAVTGPGGGHRDNEKKNENEVWLILGPDHEKTIGQLVEQNLFNLSIRLCEINQMTDQDKVDSIRIAVEYCLKLIQGKLYTKALTILSQIAVDPEHVLSIFPVTTVYGRCDQLTRIITDNDEDVFINSLIESKYLMTWRNYLRLQLSKVESKDKSEETFVCYSAIDGRAMDKNLVTYARLIDTNLIKCYLKTNPGIVASLLRIDKHCDLEITEKLLIENNRFDDLILLYKSFDCHEKALRLLSLAMSVENEEERQRRKEDLGIKDLVLPKFMESEKIIDYLKSLDSAKWDLMEMYGHWLLMNRPNEWMEVLLTWEKNIFTIHDEEEFKSSLSYRLRVLKYLPIHKHSMLIPYLEMILFTNFTSYDDTYLIERDENKAVNDTLEWNKACPTFSYYPKSGDYQSLWALPGRKVLYTLSGIQDWDTLPPIAENNRISSYDVSEFHTKYVDCLRMEIERLEPDANKLAMRVKEEKPVWSPIARLRHRLLDFLVKDEAKYNSNFLLSKIPPNSLFEERAALLFRSKRYDQVLVIWLYILDDWKSVLRICDKVYGHMKASQDVKEDDRGTNYRTDNIYHTLIGISLNDPNLSNCINMENHEGMEWEPKVDRVLEILSLYGDRISPEFVIENLPEHLYLHEVHQFFQASIIRQESELTRLVILSASANRELYESRIDRDRTMNEGFLLTDQSKCAQCWKPIGRSAFVRYFTSGDILHYGCCKDVK